MHRPVRHHLDGQHRPATGLIRPLSGGRHSRWIRPSRQELISPSGRRPPGQLTATSRSRGHGASYGIEGARRVWAARTVRAATLPAASEAGGADPTRPGRCSHLARAGSGKNSEHPLGSSSGWGASAAELQRRESRRTRPHPEPPTGRTTNRAGRGTAAPRRLRPVRRRCTGVTFPDAVAVMLTRLRAIPAPT